MENSTHTTQDESHLAFTSFVDFITDMKTANTGGFGQLLLKCFIHWKRQLKSTNDNRCFSEALTEFAEKMEQLYGSATDPTHKGNHVPTNCAYVELLGKSYPAAVNYLIQTDRSPSAVLKEIRKNPSSVGSIVKPLKVAV